MQRAVPFKHHDIPHSLLCRGDKKAAAAAAEGPDEKELKKREKQRLEKEKKELKEKQEREKKEQKEREKKENEMKKKFKVSDVILTEKVSERRGKGGVYVLAYKPVWIHSCKWKSWAAQRVQAEMESV